LVHRGTRLVQVQGLQREERYRLVSTDVERNYLHRCEQVETQSAHARKRLRYGLVVASGLLLVIAGVVIWQIIQAGKTRKAALSRDLAIQARRLGPNDVDVALLLAVEIAHLHQSTDGLGETLASLDKSPNLETQIYTK